MIITNVQAAESGKRFSVIVTEARPDALGYLTVKRLNDAKIPVQVLAIERWHGWVGQWQLAMVLLYGWYCSISMA